MYYKQSKEDVFEKFSSSRDGLSNKLLKKRQEKYGLNVLSKPKKLSPVKLFVQQFMSPLVVLLIFAVVVSFLLGHIVDSVLILVILLFNALLGFFQEYKAEKALELLRDMQEEKCIVVRGGKKVEVLSKDLVPGDVVALEEGMKVPADARVLECVGMRVDESSLTGESLSVDKSVDVLKKDLPLGERSNMVFAGTVVTEGRGLVIVVETGLKTEIGKISVELKEIKEDLSPLQKKLEIVGKWIFGIVVMISFLFFLAGLLRDISFIDSFLTSVSLAVAAIPEGLPAIVTITLALGLKKLLNKKALVRKLNAVEGLGSVSVICSDKTGTITRNEMRVEKVFVDNKEFVKFGNKKELKLIAEIGVSCNNATKELGDPTEKALIELGEKVRVKSLERLREIPFNSKDKYMVTFHPGKVYMKGALGVLLKRCSYVLVGGEKVKLTDSKREDIFSVQDSFAKDGLRVLAFAYSEKSLDQMVFVGLVGMKDPVRKGVKKAVKICHGAGIRVVMITGDYLGTARAVAKEVGIKGKAIEGENLDDFTEAEFKNIVEEYSVFARVSPHHKLRILTALQDNGEVVAMTGDGVNDALALKKADVGVAMSIKGTDVSKQVSDIILLDDNFGTIVSAVEEGRNIYSNIRKFLKFLFATNLGEVSIFVGALLFNLPLPFFPVQLLWINLVTDGLPALALGTDSSETGAMKKSPRKKNEGLFKGMNNFFLLATVLVFIVSFGLFVVYNHYYGLEKARTVAFLSLILFEMFLVFTCRSDDKVFWKLKFNKNLYGSVFLSIVLAFVVIYTPLSEYFYVVPLSFFDLLVVVPLSLLGLVVFESRKLFKFS